MQKIRQVGQLAIINTTTAKKITKTTSHNFSTLRTTFRLRGRDPFNQNSNRSDREKWSTSKGGPVFSKLFRLDRTDPLIMRTIEFGPKFPEILVEWIAPRIFLSFSSFPSPLALLSFLKRDDWGRVSQFTVRKLRIQTQVAQAHYESREQHYPT